ncbi:hypothetical protein HQO27_20610 [Rhodococcus fascians]|jgi:hypothetical protein|uniref:hypothetical protein n=1 Tax=Nocardiaceae TaxID=85025 RepID=UPI00041CD816|nr:hypothetical protein [Rhodococcus sp. JG-3]MBY4213413.1 hypothetical protein [Rhodococcus fascians]MBY4238305.1 hypothetical protein [Rhodococcus fascians]MBY4254314.1 hypothetical protein [Rhodococcus fascians]MBY4269695.1 hypothetical protein [Rhodococcus fascians]MBY4275711.1 hypothetical protein [Rhodococcus fascians]
MNGDLYENWPVTFDPPTRRIVDPPQRVLVNVALTVAGSSGGGSFRDGTPLKVRSEGLSMDVKAPGLLHAWAKTSRGQWLCCLSFQMPIGNGKGFLRLEQQWCPAEAATPVA